MPTFKSAKALKAYLKKAADALQAETLITVQSELGSQRISPKDTGRFRSSWFAAEGVASTATAPEGTDAANEDAKSLRVDSSKTYHLTNNLPYAQRISIAGPENMIKSQPTTWFKDFRDFRIPRIQAAAAKSVKAEFEL